MRAKPRPWEATYPAGCRWDTPIARGTIPALLTEAASRFAPRTALVSDGWDLTYAELGGQVARAASGLAKAGIARGDTVALLIPNMPWHPICFLALMHLGARAVHLSTLDSRRMLAHKLADSGATTLVTIGLDWVLPSALALRDDRPGTRIIVAGPGPDGRAQAGTESLDLLMDGAGPVPAAALSADDIALLQYTGGTTGRPKGAILTHGNLTAAVATYRAWDEGEPREPGGERVLGVLPLFHIYALTSVLLRHLADGNTILLRPRFDAARTLDDIARHRVTLFSGVPTMWMALLRHPASATTDFSSLRMCVSGGAPLPHALGAQVEAMIGQRLCVGWGMTETAPAGTRVPRGVAQTPGLIGVPLPGVDMRVVDPDDPSRALPPDTDGEIAVRGANVFAGYWNRPEETARAFRDGWFLTGDIGRMAADGLFTLRDRRGNMIISSGFNVYPAAIEAAIAEHPDVTEVAVIGVPDAYRGEAAKAFVVLRDGAARLTLDALRDFLRDRLGRHEMPAALELRDALPRSAAGKILASALAEQERAEAATGQPARESA